MTARELRVWHWRRVLSARETQAGICSKRTDRASERLANFHICAVQVLNDHPQCQGFTVHQDDELFPKPHSRRKKW